jgi:hypothetical protein
LFALVLALSLPQAAEARDKDKDGPSKKNRPAATAQRGGGGPTPGTCTVGTVTRTLDINRVNASVFNTGSLFYGGNLSAAYNVGGDSPIYASGIWIGGKVGDELRVAGSRYTNFEFWPGPLNEDGSAPADCSQYDRIYKVSASDIQTYEQTGTAATDLDEWPAELGAPVIAAANNDFDDDGDGIIDEGTDGIDNDDDGLIDERDELERLDPDLRPYDLAAGDRPDLIGDQALWWVMNDVGNTHDETLSNPIGVEVRVQAFAFNRDNALGDITFYKYTIEYKGSEPLTEAYLSIFSDPDLGNAADDYVGVDTDLSLGFVYNADNFDDNYYGANPPAAGYDFFQGPAVDTDDDGVADSTLGLTSFAYFINGGPPELTDPGVAEEYYAVMQGLAPNGNLITEFGNGVTGQGDPTIFAFPGDPVAGEFWSEVNIDDAGSRAQPGDRRLVQSTGPFTIQPGDVQEIVYGLVYARGNSNISSITALRVADASAQAAFDADFEVPAPPPSPERCVEGAPLFFPGSGNCLEAVQLNEEVILTWGYSPGSDNYLGQFDQLGYEFEGFNIYRYANSNFSPLERELVATFDVANGITTVNNLPFDPTAGTIIPTPAAFGTDSGIQYYYRVQDQSLVNNLDYYYGVSAYAINEDAPIELVLESAPTTITVRPSSTDIQGGGTVINVDPEGVIFPTIAATGPGGGFNSDINYAQVVDPVDLTGDTYEIRFFNPVGDDGNEVDVLVYSIVNATTGETILDGQEVYDRTGEAPPLGNSVVTADGLSFSVRGPDPGPLEIGGTTVFVETVAPGGTPACEVNPALALCPEGFGNTVVDALNSTGTYFLTVNGPAGSAETIGAYAPQDYEIRFGDPSYAIYYFNANEDVAQVPFSVWDVGPIGGAENDPSDDVQLIPVLFADNGGVCEFEFGEGALAFGAYPTTDRIYAYYATTSYDDWAAEAETLLGGDSDACVPGLDTGIVDLIDFGRGRPLQRQAIGDFGTPNGTIRDLDGAVIRFVTTKPNQPGDVYQVNTLDLVATTGDAEAAEEALDGIGVVPNPYRGRSLYERETNDRRVRFVGLPEQATISIFTVAGTLIRTIQKTGGGPSVDWDLTTQADLPVASGMYIVHVDARNGEGASIGERVLKLGVIQRQTEVTTF